MIGSDGQAGTARGGFVRRPLVASALILPARTFFGAVVQKTYGFGNLLRGAGIPYPTLAPPDPTGPVAVEIPPAHHGGMSLFLPAG